MNRFSVDVDDKLRRAGWYPGRDVSDQVTLWKQSLMAFGGFEMFHNAERILREFGGLIVDDEGPGITCAREPFEINPMRAAYENDRFARLSAIAGTRLYPLGEGARGHYYIAVGENDYVYILMEEIMIIGKNIEEALENLLLGLAAKEINS